MPTFKLVFDDENGEINVDQIHDYVHEEEGDED